MTSPEERRQLDVLFLRGVASSLLPSLPPSHLRETLSMQSPLESANCSRSCVYMDRAPPTLVRGWVLQVRRPTGQC